jgi:hypothetical protein
VQACNYMDPWKLTSVVHLYWEISNLGSPQEINWTWDLHANIYNTMKTSWIMHEFRGLLLICSVRSAMQKLSTNFGITQSLASYYFLSFLSNKLN